MVGDTEFTIFDIEGGKFNLSACDERWVTRVNYDSADDAAAALPRLVNNPNVGPLLTGRDIPGELSAWTPEPRELANSSNRNEE